MPPNELDLLHLTKLDVAERQLNMAIQMFFDEQDPVSIHTLAGAAGQVLRDIGKERGIHSTTWDMRSIAEDKRKEWAQFLVQARNFFKHADKDTNGTIHFAPVLNDHMLLDAIGVHEALTNKATRESQIFVSWMALKYPDHFKPGSKIFDISDRWRSNGISPENKKFFRNAICLLNQGKSIPFTTPYTICCARHIA